MIRIKVGEVYRMNTGHLYECITISTYRAEFKPITSIDSDHNTFWLTELGIMSEIENEATEDDYLDCEELALSSITFLEGEISKYKDIVDDLARRRGRLD